MNSIQANLKEEERVNQIKDYMDMNNKIILLLIKVNYVLQSN